MQDKLVAALQAGIQDPAFVQRMSELGAQVVSKDKATPEGLRAQPQGRDRPLDADHQKAGVYAD